MSYRRAFQTSSAWQTRTNWRDRAVSPEEVVAHLQSAQRVFLHGAGCTPTVLIDAMCRRDDLEAMSLYSLHLAGDMPFSAPALSSRFRSVSLFTGPGQRAAVAAGEADFIPVFLKDIPGLFTSRSIPLDAAILRLSPPDRHGHCTLGTSVDTAVAAAESAGMILAEINPNVPRTHGHTTVRFEDITAFCLSDAPMHCHESRQPTPVEARIGELVADLVDHGSTLQMGIGAIPDAALARMGDKIDLGVHTEMFSDGLLPLIEGGVITNKYKRVHAGRTVTSFVSGSERLFDFVHDNFGVEFHPCDRTNDTTLIRKNPKVVAINSAIEVDLTGQVCADSMGHKIFSGIGGQMDFIHGAALSEGGKPIIALPSTAAHGQVSRITAQLKDGAGVVTTRGHVQWVVTEYGAVNLHGKTLRERAELLIGIAHPDFRAELSRRVREIRHFVL